MQELNSHSSAFIPDTELKLFPIETLTMQIKKAQWIMQASGDASTEQ